jgi:bacteriocin-like protein
MSNHNVESNLSNNELSEKQLDEVSGGGARDQGGVTLSEFSIVKLTDAATPKLYEAACKGTHIPQVTVQL